MKLHDQAMGLLSRREHSQIELRRKLMSKGYAAEDVAIVLEDLASRGLQSDARYTEAYVRSRMLAGFGPRRIAMELAQRGIVDDLMAQYVPPDRDYWWPVMLAAWRKKFAKPAQGAKDYAKQIRFLLQRGFASDDIHILLKNREKSNEK